MHRRRMAVRALLGGVLATGLVLAAAPAAAAPPENLTEVDAGPYSLADNGSFDTLEPWVSSLDGKLPVTPFADVVADGNREARELCQDTGIDGATGFCWNEGDENTADWYPQGLTGSWDATESGSYEGHRAMFASWYNKTGDKGVRVSLVNYDDPANPTYRHILLVEPTSGEDFKQVDVHAGGIAWVGNHLYVVDTSKGVRVFDLRHLWKTEPDETGSKIGKGDDGKYYAYNYGYALPQVGAYSQEGSGDCDPPPDQLNDPLCFSYVGVDRGSSPPSLLTGEYYNGAGGARLVRWPFDPSTGLLEGGSSVAASKAYQSPYQNMQGAVSYEDTFLMTRSRGADTRGLLYRTTVGEAGSESTIPAGPEDLSYQAAEQRAWTLGEHPGNRPVFSIPDGS
ncbi:MAG: hypothetical protein GEU98_11520 [Pseudonocardiaceae bacterium]|nr:hypothetical protein [Pseudonocardiaceae bacterium]